MPIKLVLAEDQYLVREGLRRLLEAQEDLEVAAVCEDLDSLLAAVDEQYALGVEPLALMRALMDLTHRITLAQVSGGEPDAPAEDERAALTDFAARLGAAELHRLWQLLLKGHDEVRTGPDPLVSLQMALLRILHAAQMPDPGKLAKRIEEIAASSRRAISAARPACSTVADPLCERIARS